MTDSFTVFLYNINRPIQQEERPRTSGGSFHKVYALARFGAERLRDLHGNEISGDRWRQKNREIRGRSIQHTLATARFMVDLELATRSHEPVSLLHLDQLRRLLPMPQRSTQSGLSISARVDWYGYQADEATVADQLFGLADERLPEDRRYQFAFLEIDQGTETIEPGKRKIRSKSFFRDTSVLRKLAIYAAAFRTRAHQKQFGLPVFRVLTVTSTPERVVLMQEAYQRHLSAGTHAVNPGLFLFADWLNLARHHGSLLSAPLQTAAGKRVTLSD